MRAWGNVTRMDEFDVVSASGSLLFANGQTTERTVSETQRVAAALGQHVTVIPHWGELVIHFPHDPGARNEIVTVAPTGIDMGKILAANDVIDDLCDGRIDAAAARAALDAAARRPPVSLVRFVVAAAAGAAALGVIFGVSHPITLLLIALSAGAGACIRRWLAGRSHNAFVQPLAAALLGGLVGAAAERLKLSSALLYVSVCPCMILVPGGHVLNGAIDLIRARIALGASRLLFASMVILVICVGLLCGLALGGADLPVSGASPPAPFGYDVVAAGIAVSAFGSFFAMPWRMLPIPIAIGMLAHALRWVAIALAGTSVQVGALVACLFVGTIATPVAGRLRLPFAAFAFASVVSMIPGVYLFRMAGGIVAVSSLGVNAPPELLPATFADASTALLIIMAMTFGVIVPRMCIEYFYSPGAR
jgi:uncharacterized membrane protein YjjP (DUF1212 family)